MKKSTRLILMIATCQLITISAEPHNTVYVRNGNVFLNGRNGAVIQLTNSGLDSEPNISFDSTAAVFVRRTPAHLVTTAAGITDENELWIVSTAPPFQARRVFAGHNGRDAAKSVGGFTTPQFSKSGKKIYFVGQRWATVHAIYCLDLENSSLQLLAPGYSVEVIRSGHYDGYIIVDKDVLKLTPGRMHIFVLLDPMEKEVGIIGTDDSDLNEFKQLNSIE